MVNTGGDGQAGGARRRSCGRPCGERWSWTATMERQARGLRTGWSARACFDVDFVTQGVHSRQGARDLPGEGIRHVARQRRVAPSRCRPWKAPALRAPIPSPTASSCSVAPGTGMGNGWASPCGAPRRRSGCPRPRRCCSAWPDPRPRPAPNRGSPGGDRLAGGGGATRRVPAAEDVDVARAPRWAAGAGGPVRFPGARDGVGGIGL